MTPRHAAPVVPAALGCALLLLAACGDMGDTMGDAPPNPADPPPQPFKAGERCGYRDTAGATVAPARFHLCQPFGARALAAAAGDDGWVWLDRTGRTVARPFVVDNGPDAFRDGRARFVGADGRLGFIDEDGAVAIPAHYDAARPFSGGLAPVCRGCRTVRDGEHAAWTGGKWGYVDRDGVQRIPFRYDDAWPADPATPGRLHVRLGDCETAIDTAGTITEPACR